MFRFSYRFMARPALRKGAAKVAKAVKVPPVKGLAPPAASILNAPVAPPLEVVPPRTLSPDMTPQSHATTMAADAGKARAASSKKPLKRPAKKVANNTFDKPTSTKVKAKSAAPKLTPKKPMKLKVAKKPKAKEVPKGLKAVKSKASQTTKSKPKRK